MNGQNDEDMNIHTANINENLNNIKSVNAEENENATFASQLPSWDLLPPSMAIRRVKRSI